MFLNNRQLLKQLNHTSMGLGEFKGRFQQFFGVIYQSFVCVCYLF